MQQWYVHDKGATTGPFTAEQVKDSIKSGTIGAEATFCATGTTTFRPLSEVPELVPAKPVELPIAATPAKCGACTCPVFRVVKKLAILALMATIAWVLYTKFGGCCTKPVIRPL